MDELIIDYKLSKKGKIRESIISFLLGLSGLYVSIEEGLLGNFNVMFYLGLFCFLLGFIVVLLNTFKLPTPILNMNSKQIVVKLSPKNKFTLDWANISKVNIGPGYITFLLNGEQKQQKMELGTLMYEDVIKVKSKVIELCEFKNIPYHND